MLTLGELLYIICNRTNIHVCIHDISGILEKDNLKIDGYFQRHSKPFCDLAKSSEKGYNACIACKDNSNRKAALGKDFSRHCPYGIYEIIRPVIIDGKVRCIIYVGNLATSLGELEAKAKFALSENGISHCGIEKYVTEAEEIKDEAYYIRLADFLRDFIIDLYNEDSGENYEKPQYHWCVSQVCEYAKLNYRQNMTLKSLSNLYFINEKYLGRIFKRQLGKSFNEYLTELRFKKAVRLLLEGKAVNIVAGECGFQSVTYFNRLFKAKYGISPTQYRKMKR